MAVAGGPNTSESGLVLCLDAGNPRSYRSGSTTWFDLSGNDNSGSFISSSGYDSANFGSIVFSGTSSYVDCGSGSSLNVTSQITLSAWINGSYTSVSEHSVIDKGGISGHHFGVYQQKIIFQTNVAYRQSNTSLSNNIWYNIVAVYDKTNVYFYLNGVADGTQTLTGGLNAPTSSVWISRYTNASPLNFNGRIALAQIYNRALSAQEVKQNYDALKTRFQ